MLKILQEMYKLEFSIISHEVDIVFEYIYDEEITTNLSSGEHGNWSRQVRIL